MKPVKAFALVTKNGLICNQFDMYAGRLREEIGRMWNKKDPRAGWAMAKAEGFRIRRVLVTLDITETGHE